MILSLATNCDLIVENRSDKMDPLFLQETGTVLASRMYENMGAG